MNQPSVKKNYFYNMAYQTLSLITPLITTPYVSRVLGADGVGIYSYTSSIMAYFTMFAALGTALYGSREIARVRDNIHERSKTFWEIELLLLLTTFVCTIGWGLLIAYSDFYAYYFVALTPLLIAIAFDISWFYTGMELMGYTVARNSICRIIGIIVLFIFVREKDDLFIYMLLNSLIQLIGNITMWTYLRKLIVRVSLQSLRVLRHLQATMSFFILNIAISLYTVLDKVLIGYITGDSFQNGYYEQATKIINLSKTMAFAALNTVMSARLAYLFAKGEFEEIHRRIEHSVDFVLFMVYGFVFGIISVSHNFVPIFFGGGYEPVEYLLYLMSPLLIFVALSTCLGSHYFIPSGKVKLSTNLTIIGSVVNLIANLLMIPKFGAQGAVVGTLIGEGVIALLYCYFGRSYVSWHLIVVKSYKRIVAGFFMLVGASLVENFCEFSIYLKLLSQFFVVSFVYVLLLLIMKDKFIINTIDQIKIKLSDYGKN